MGTRIALAAALLTLLSFVIGARAQVSRAPTVAVLEVRVRPKLASSPALSRTAIDTMMAGFARRLHYKVTSREEVERAMKGSFSSPLSPKEIQRIGKKLGVDRVATGEITEIAFTEKPRRACIKFSLSVFDVVDGELVHGAVSTGYSPPDATGSDDALIELAVKNSVTDAARPGINTVSLPTATILNIRKTAQNTIEVPLNRGTRDGFRLGQVLMVIRGGERTGRVRITTIGPTDSKATAIEGGDKIKPEDQAIGIYEIEGYQ